MYYAYSDYLKRKYGEKVYKIPVNLPGTCPNRLRGQKGCDFCSEKGTGFESLPGSVPVREQLLKNKQLIEKKYHAHKFIAYFQNYTNTFMEPEQFRKYIEDAADFPDVIEISISTRPDCISREYLDICRRAKEEKDVSFTIELGLQTVNYHTLSYINRGHTLAEYIDAVLMIKEYGFDICTHVILNLPGDGEEDCVETAKILSVLHTQTVKIHSLYIAKNTRLCEAYENGTITLCTKEEYIERLISFLENLSPDIAVERLFSRVPKKDAAFSNWGSSWWKLRDEALNEMKRRGSYQGRRYGCLCSSALRYLQEGDAFGRKEKI